MAKTKTLYVCSDCGASAGQWAGQCTECKAWNTLNLQREHNAPGRSRHYAGAASPLTSIADVPLQTNQRYASGIAELDRVLGGGVVPGSVTLLGGDPGIGKSTLLLQALAAFDAQHSTLYITGEESLQQVALRAARLQLNPQRMQLMAETQVEHILATARAERPPVIVIDSIQTIHTEQLSASPGSVSQVRESTAQIVRFAKAEQIAVFLVGHVTKEGTIAGPRVLEHMVDTVLSFEATAGSRFRLLRSNKNRFGAVNELGVFAMDESGLKGVSNPSAIFLSRHPQPVPGSVITATMEGTRPLLLELQVLVESCHGGQARRLAVGVDGQRLHLLLAILHRHAGVAMYDQDVYANAVGGVRVNETAVDLPLLLAAVSSLRDAAISDQTLVFGELGLAGEVRPVPEGQIRLREAAAQGIRRAIVPKANCPKQPPKDMELIGVSRLSEAIEAIVSP